MSKLPFRVIPLPYSNLVQRPQAQPSGACVLSLPGDLKRNSGRYFLCILLFKKWKRWSKKFLHEKWSTSATPSLVLAKRFHFPACSLCFLMWTLQRFKCKDKIISGIGNKLKWKKNENASILGSMNTLIKWSPSCCKERSALKWPKAKRNPDISAKTQNFAQPQAIGRTLNRRDSLPPEVGTKGGIKKIWTFSMTLAISRCMRGSISRLMVEQGQLLSTILYIYMTDLEPIYALLPSVIFQ